ncbi:hypothetical protein GCM10022255_113080 [Dactylosporangium darangshiense]|uniref:Uncharacterized protein n=1 Tax=Dactylosporangium darangshiense TaxID=579108 RepID=A0ABP8DVD1_9ACTN
MWGVLDVGRAASAGHTLRYVPVVGWTPLMLSATAVRPAGERDLVTAADPAQPTDRRLQKLGALQYMHPRRPWLPLMPPSVHANLTARGHSA